MGRRGSERDRQELGFSGIDDRGTRIRMGQMDKKS